LEKYKDAIDCFDKAIELSPSEPSYYTDKGGALYELKKYDESIIFYEKAIELSPNYADAYNDKGNALFELKNTEKQFKVMIKH
jgi:tetratricopeptide (TPR) repeat protein